MKSYYIFLLIIIVIFVPFSLSKINKQKTSTQNTKIDYNTNSNLIFSIETNDIDRIMYNKGFNAALDAMALLNLELNIKKECKTWEEMQNILRKRFNIPNE